MCKSRDIEVAKASALHYMICKDMLLGCLEITFSVMSYVLLPQSKLVLKNVFS